MENKVVLGYWNIRGLSERIRQLIEYCGIPYDQQFHSGAQGRAKWINQLKPELIKKNPAITLPYLKDGDQIIAQSEAIIVYICHKANRLDLLGRDVDEKVLLATTYGVFKDIYPQVTRFCYANYDGNNAFEAAQIATREPWRVYIKKLDGILGDKDFMAGGLTWVDFAVADFVQVLGLLDAELTKDFPRLVSYQKRVWSLPELAEYFKSDRFHERPINNYSAFWK